jgi:hypothetical protein
MRVTCPAYLILHDLIAVMLFDEEYKLYRPSYANSPVSYNFRRESAYRENQTHISTYVLWVA